MGCGCKISEPNVIGTYVDHSECRYAELEAKLKDALAANVFEKAWTDKLKEFGTIDRLIEEYSAYKNKAREAEARSAQLLAAVTDVIRLLESDSAEYDDIRPVLEHLRALKGSTPKDSPSPQSLESDEVID